MWSHVIESLTRVLAMDSILALPSEVLQNLLEGTKRQDRRSEIPLPLMPRRNPLRSSSVIARP